MTDTGQFDALVKGLRLGDISRLTEVADAIEALQRDKAAAEAQVAALREALTPSGATKAAYIGEFKFAGIMLDADGDETAYKLTVPWTTTKEIMAAILARAAAALKATP